MKIAYVCSHTFLQDCIDSSSVVLDCGVNQGAFSEWLSNNIGCSVYGFEPDPRLFSVLPRLTRCSFYQLAVSDSQGAMRFNLGDTQCSSLHYKESEKVNAIEVQVITLPEFCTKHGIQKVDLLKLDIEGAEVPVLAGLDEAFLVSRISQITCEYHDFLDRGAIPQVKATIYRLRELGFYYFRLSYRSFGDVLFVNRRFIHLSKHDQYEIYVNKYMRLMAFYKRKAKGCLSER